MLAAWSRRHRRVKDAWGSPRTRPCPLQLSAQYELGAPTVSSAPSQLQSTGLKMLLELPGMKLDAEGSREQESQTRAERTGWAGICRAPGEGRGIRFA